MLPAMQVGSFADIVIALTAIGALVAAILSTKHAGHNKAK